MSANRRSFDILFWLPDGQGMTLARTVRRRSRVAALATARKLLAPHVRHCTRFTWHREGRFLATVDVYAPGGTYETVEAERIEGPAVCDVGVW